MSRRKNEIGLTTAARVLEVHPNTLRTWARDRLEDGEKSPPLQTVRRTLTGRYFIPRDEVRRLMLSHLNPAPENDF